MPEKNYDVYNSVYIYSIEISIEFITLIRLCNAAIFPAVAVFIAVQISFLPRMIIFSLIKAYRPDLL